MSTWRIGKLKLAAKNYLVRNGWYSRNNKEHLENEALASGGSVPIENESSNESAVQPDCSALTSKKNYQRELSKLSSELRKQEKRGEQLNEALSLRNESLSRQREALDRQREALSRQREAAAINREAIGKLREQVRNLKKFEPLRKQASFLKNCLDNSEKIQSEAYVAHEVLPLLAASVLSEKYSSKLMCNVVEIPSFKDRAVNTPWDPVVLKIIDDQVNEQLRNCDQLITIGPALANEILYLNDKVSVIPNYRYKENIQYSGELRKRCSLKESDKLVLALSTIASGFEAVLESFASLPRYIHLATMGKFVPKEYEQKIKSIVKEKGLSQRVHFLEPVEYERLTSVSSGADLGLIVQDPLIKNNYISLPNRVFDYISSELPIVSPAVPDVSNYINEYNIGEVLPDMDPNSWSDAIIKCLNKTEIQKENIRDLKDIITWESLEPALLDLFHEVDSVTFLGLNKLAKNNRTLRMARSLLNSGKKVVICGMGDKREVTLTDDNLEYIFFEKL